jgi:hypothetical protein
MCAYTQFQPNKEGPFVHPGTNTMLDKEGSCVPALREAWELITEIIFSNVCALSIKVNMPLLITTKYLFFNYKSQTSLQLIQLLAFNPIHEECCPLCLLSCGLVQALSGGFPGSCSQLSL